MYLESEKEIKSHEEERRKCRCRNGMNVGYQTEMCCGQQERQQRLSWEKLRDSCHVANQYLAKLTFGFF